MTWSPVTMRWPSSTTSWLADLDAAKTLATSELTSTGERITALKDLSLIHI